MGAMDGTRSKKAKDRTITWFPLDRIDELEGAILDQLRDRKRARRRDALACALGLSGLRSGEVSQLALSDLQVPLRRLRVRTLKGGPERALALHESLVRELLGWRGLDRQRLLFAKLAPSSLLLPSNRGGQVRREQFNAMAKRLFDELLGSPLHGLTFHGLRHTFAMRVYQESRDLFLTQRLLGHSSVQTTEIYAKSLATIPEGCLVKLGKSRLADVITVVGLDSLDAAKAG